MNELTIKYQKLDHWSQLDTVDKELVEKAREISEDAYAPYSKFNVGAALLLENGKVVVGNNQENIAFPSGLCAERVALFFAGANFAGVAVKKIVIVGKGDLVPVDKILSPCGSCRQVMIETEIRQPYPFEVILVSQNGQTLIFNAASDLLPFAF